MKHWVQVKKLGWVASGVPERYRMTRRRRVVGIYVIAQKVNENHDLACALRTGGHNGRGSHQVSKKDYDRWCAATDELVEKIRALAQKEQDIARHIDPSERHTLWWHIRNAKRNLRLRRNYSAAVAELRAEFDAAVAEYHRRAGDFVALIAEEEQRKREEKEREAARAEERRRQRAEVMAKADGPIWAYNDSTDDVFLIFVPELDKGHRFTRSGLTPRQVQQALQERRVRNPYLEVEWCASTDRALREAHGFAVDGWHALTGERIDPHPRKHQGWPVKRTTKSTRAHGPSSTYGSDGGGGFGSFSC